MIALARLMRELVVSAVAPNRCAACDTDVPMMRAFCPTCAATLTLPEARDPRHVAAFVYGGAIARAISRFKFEPRPDLARPLATVLQRAARVFRADPPDRVIPVPLHPARLIERGYNQSALLAGPVAKDLGARFLPRALVRIRDTERQVGLDRATRRTNVAHGFSVSRASTVSERRVLLVDDVRTTGSTLAACVSVLLEAGARDVRTLVVAQTDDVSGAALAGDDLEPRLPRRHGADRSAASGS
jgi:ComF family protein